MKTKNILAILLLMVAGIQKVWTQTITLHMADSQTITYDVSQLDSITFDDNGQQPQEAIVVTVDAYGNADGGHYFTKIDENNFYIDYIKYRVKDGNLIVSGYNNEVFKGAATIISTLKYEDRTLSVISIDYYAFSGCSSLTSVAIPEGVTYIGKNAFSYCSSLTSVTIPNSVTSIDNYAFQDCTSLTTVTIPEAVTSIEYRVFWGCSSLTSVTIPEGVTSILKEAFYGCSSLTSVTIPNNVYFIGGYAFGGCIGLTDVYCYATDPPSAYDSFSLGLFSSATLHVPASSVDAYKATSPWSDFETIVAIE